MQRLICYIANMWDNPSEYKGLMTRFYNMLANKWTTSEPADLGCCYCYHLLLFPAWAPTPAP